MTDAVASADGRSRVERGMSQGSALFIALLVTFGLGALAFWPRPTWSPPRRPAFQAPIVFDEFVNPPAPTGANSSASDPAAH